ncbi:MAG: PP2C family protein-serine/threonine phosphatase [Parachlamydia sp.]|nr:PP2C family protein-serine/threonine phosphatase [Parachlamydia sp.]
MEAAAYVISLLPEPIPDSNSPVTTAWKFIPSTQLGGDAFGYHWLDPTHFALYLLDVCGHGVGAAVLSISIMNVLRAQTLPNTDFYNPSAVLATLNEAFPMEQNNNMFFTMWYGVYHTSTRELVYSSGGHPPAILFTGANKSQAVVKELKTPGLVIGGMSGAAFTSATCTVERYGKLYLFSDGVYEIEKPDGSTYTLSEFVQVLEQPALQGIADIDRIQTFAQDLNGPGAFADDFSLIEAIFS